MKIYYQKTLQHYHKPIVILHKMKKDLQKELKQEKNKQLNMLLELKNMMKLYQQLMLLLL